MIVVNYRNGAVQQFDNASDIEHEDGMTLLVNVVVHVDRTNATSTTSYGRHIVAVLGDDDILGAFVGYPPEKYAACWDGESSAIEPQGGEK